MVVVEIYRHKVAVVESYRYILAEVVAETCKCKVAEEQTYIHKLVEAVEETCRCREHVRVLLSRIPCKESLEHKQILWQLAQLHSLSLILLSPELP